MTADVNVGGGDPILPNQQACSAGGIVGSGNNVTLSRCTYAGTLSVSVTSDYVYAGGIAGKAEGSTISSCTHTGTIRMDGSTGEYIQVGGIVGRNQNVTLTGNVWEDGIPNKETGDE